MPRVTSWKVPREWEGETAFIIAGGPSLQGFDAEILRGRGRIIAVNTAGLVRPPGETGTTPHCPWADVLYWADKNFFEVNHARLGEHRGRYKIARHLPELPNRKDLARALAREHDIKVLPRANPYAQLSAKLGELGGWCGGGNAINLAYLFGARRIVLLGFDMHFGSDRKHWHRLAPWPQAPEMEKRYRSHHMPAIAAMAWPLQQAGVEVVNCTPGSALSCFPIRPIEEVLMEDERVKSGEAVVSRLRAEDLEGLPEAKPGGIQVLEDHPGEHRGLELVPMPQVDTVIAGLKLHRRGVKVIRVVVRLAGGDVVTRRSVAWWQRKLAVAFPVVVVESADRHQAVFGCADQAPAPAAEPVIAAGAGAAVAKS
jgi:hypothetical protein